jgi:hypothetical protein
MEKRLKKVPVRQASKIHIREASALEDILRDLNERDKKIGIDVDAFVRRQKRLVKVVNTPVDDLNVLRSYLAFRIANAAALRLRKAYFFARKQARPVKRTLRTLTGSPPSAKVAPSE